MCYLVVQILVAYYKNFKFICKNINAGATFSCMNLVACLILKLENYVILNFGNILSAGMLDIHLALGKKLDLTVEIL
jgi:hypothetical protein